MTSTMAGIKSGNDILKISLTKWEGKLLFAQPIESNFLEGVLPYGIDENQLVLFHNTKSATWLKKTWRTGQTARSLIRWTFRLFPPVLWNHIKIKQIYRG